MRKRYRRNRFYIMVFLVIMSSIGVGYAAFISTLIMNCSKCWYNTNI